MMKPNIVILLCGLSRAVVAVIKKREVYAVEAGSPATTIET